MQNKNVIKLLKSKNIVIPSFLLANYKKLKINEKELLLLCILIDNNSIEFDPISLEEQLSWKQEETMLVFSSLCDKNIINLKVKKEDNKMKEYISIDNLYDKVLMEVLDESSSDIEESTIYKTIEEELGRTLSPIEYETIGSWLNSNISEELIKEALKEAVLNGVHNLKYIDKILYEWSKKGYKKATDVKKKSKKNKPQEELFDYDWLDESL